MQAKRIKTMGGDGDNGLFNGGPFSETSRKSIIPLAVVLVVFALIIIIVYIVYRVKNDNLKSVTVISEPVKLFEVGDADVSNSKLTSVPSGQEYSYTFWLYLLDYSNVSAEDRIVFMRGGGDTSSLSKSVSPLVFMDGKTNRLYITVGTNVTAEVLDLKDFRESENLNNKMVTAVVEYVPMQRWVNVTFTVQDNLLTVFLDGDMYSVKNVHDLWNGKSDTSRPVFKGTSGNVHVGPTSDHSEAVNGYLSGLKTYNYTVMQKDAKAIYNKGPVSRGFLERLGIPEYGVQAPIYRID